MSGLAEIESSIDEFLKGDPYGRSPDEHQSHLLRLLKTEMAFACDHNPAFRNFVEHWPINYRTAPDVASLPYLPVGAFRSQPALSLVDGLEIVRMLSSSATSGQTPSRIALDRSTARRMTRSMALVIRNFIGTSRRPYLVVDSPDNLKSQTELSARGAAIKGLLPFATETAACLANDGQGKARLDLEALTSFVDKWKDADVLVYGFTYVIWTSLVEPLNRLRRNLGLSNSFVLHSGGWKRLEEQAVDRRMFNEGVAATVGCAPDRVIDYYGMVENVGVVYPDCQFGNKHVPAFGDVVIRHPLTLQSVKAGEEGTLQFCSVLPTSFPGFLVLTDDIAKLLDYDGCPCGRRGTFFRFVGRVPKMEMRGCGNLTPARSAATGKNHV